MLRFDECNVQQNKSLFTINELMIEQGQFIALIGANGTGKSTFLSSFTNSKLIQGSFKYNGSDWSAIPVKERAKMVALVDNRFQGLEHLSTLEYLELGRFPHTNFIGRLTDNDNELISQIASEMQLTSLLKQATSTLSDGERQRASIARALIQETPIILLDEPTSFLDYPTKRFVMNQLRDIAKKQGKLIIMSTHDLEMSVEYCSVWLVINPTTKNLEVFKEKIDLEQLIEVAFPMV